MSARARFTRVKKHTISCSAQKCATFCQRGVVAVYGTAMHPTCFPKRMVLHDCGKGSGTFFSVFLAFVLWDLKPSRSLLHVL